MAWVDIGNEVWGDWDADYRPAATYANDLHAYATAIHARAPGVHIAGEGSIEGNRSRRGGPKPRSRASPSPVRQVGLAAVEHVSVVAAALAGSHYQRNLNELSQLSDHELADRPARFAALAVQARLWLQHALGGLTVATDS